MLRPRTNPLAWAVLLLTGIAAAAPAAASTLSGRILDPQGKAIAGARVRVEDEAARSREAATDSTGAFTFLELPPGAYTLMAESAGFAPATRSGLDLAVGQSYRIDVSLSVAGVAESV